MKLLIIGGTGVLSGAVVNEALANDIDITIVNRGKKKNIVPDGVTMIKADYHNKLFMMDALKGQHYDAVIDFICYDVSQIDYSINLLHTFADQYIFISTSCVYNTSIPGIKTEESEKVLKDWNYSVNKWEAECLLVKKSKELGFNYSIVRPCVTYDDTRIPYGIMPSYGYHWTFCARILEGKPILRWDKGLTKWNMMRVEDFAIGVIGIIGNRNAYGEAYNLCGDTPYEWNDVLNIISKFLNVDPIVIDVTSQEYKALYPGREGEISARSLDAIVSNKKIKELVPSYKTTFTLEDGVRKTLNAYLQSNYQHGIDWNFDAETDRIIRKWCKQNKSKGNYKLGFVDYLQNATIKNKLRYWIVSNEDNPLVGVFKRILKF